MIHRDVMKRIGWRSTQDFMSSCKFIAAESTSAIGTDNNSSPTAYSWDGRRSRSSPKCRYLLRMMKFISIFCLFNAARLCRTSSVEFKTAMVASRVSSQLNRKLHQNSLLNNSPSRFLLRLSRAHRPKRKSCVERKTKARRKAEKRMFQVVGAVPPHGEHRRR